jgi:hypothetical protein
VLRWVSMVVKELLLEGHRDFTALVPIPEWQRAASCRPIRVLAPGTALELLPSRALPSAQVQGIVAAGTRMYTRNT